jgi:FkbM family methyltransferase
MLAGDTLEAQVDGSPLLRRVATSDDLSKPSALYCFRAETASAQAWFRQQAGRAPEQLVTMDGVLKKWKRPMTPPPELQTVVFGARLRTKATRLAAHGFAELLYAADPKLAQTRTAPNFLQQNRAALEQLWQALEDTESRFVLASIVRQRVTGELGYLRVSQYAEYCHPSVKAEPGETVIDAGAFNGATSASFARRVGRRGLVYAFEPGTENRRLIQRRLWLPWNWRLRVEIVPQAISDAVGRGYFEAGRGGSGTLREAAGEPGVEQTPLTTLDHFASTRGKIDLISLDIEGAEPAALAGAETLIREQRPKLQVSVYHVLSHLLDIPLMLREKYPDYALFLGHHDVYSTETDAYLVPRERLRA